MTNRRLDPATFQALQALVSRGHMRVGPRLARDIRERRESRNRTLQALAGDCDIELEAMTQIEAGAATIPAATLVKLAQALDVDLVWFIEREPTIFAGPEGGGPFEVEGSLIEGKQGLALLRAFAAIKDAGAREKVLKLAQSFAAGADGDGNELEET